MAEGSRSLGFTQFSLRGLEKVQAEFKLVMPDAQPEEDVLSARHLRGM
jgi:hypothetical protein